MSARSSTLALLNGFRDFSQRALKLSLTANVVQLACNIGLTVAVVVLVSRPDTVTVPIGIDKDGKVIPLVQLNKANLSEVQVKQWFTNAVQRCFTMGPNNWRMVTEDCREHFTRDGYDQWLSELDKSHFFELVDTGGNVSEIVPMGPAVIVEKREFQGRLALIMEYPTKITFSVGRQSRSFNWIIRAYVLRVDTSERYRGIAIQQFQINLM